MSKRGKGDKSSAAQVSVAPTPVERPPTPEPEAVEGALKLSEWEQQVEKEEASILCAAQVRKCVDLSAAALQEKYLQHEAIPCLVSTARRALNSLIEMKFITLDTLDREDDEYDVVDEPDVPPLESYFCTMQEATSDDSESVDVQPSFHRDVSKYTMRRMACEHEAAQRVSSSADGEQDHRRTKEIIAEMTAAPSRLPVQDGLASSGLPTGKKSSLPNEALSGPVGEAYRLDSIPPRQQAARSGSSVEQQKHRDLLAMTASVPELSNFGSRASPDLPLLSRSSSTGIPSTSNRVRHLQDELEHHQTARQEHFMTLGHPQLEDAVGSEFQQPPLGRQIDFSTAYRRVQVQEQQKRLERQHAKALEDRKRNVPTEHFAWLRDELHRTKAREMEKAERAFRLSSLPQRPNQTSGMTEAQKQALGLDKSGRAKMVEVPLRGRIQRLASIRQQRIQQ